MKARGMISNEVANTLYQYACDSTKLLAKGYSDISVYRKFALKSQVQPSYQQLCAKRTFGSMLFGNDLAKEVKNIAEESKIMRQFNKVPPQPVYAQRHHPYAIVRSPMAVIGLPLPMYGSCHVIVSSRFNYA